MKRTIEVKRYYLYYKGKEQFLLNPNLCEYFRIRRGKFVVTIKLGKKFRFKLDDYKIRGSERRDYDIFNEKNESCGFVCVEFFQKFFFKPNQCKRYDITVKRLKQRRAK
ncbi:hypothetical protein LCGC14_2461670 [marine sediment metagenome]|uniref:Uncharacterized protein n=1 Tax=marine sediment metagenome TaxID=412755 RepID=A0A0F9C0T2_9ZZZZ